MGIEQLLLQKVRELPPQLQLQALNFLEHLRATWNPTASAQTPQKSLYGSWADLGVTITEEDIAEIRREMWGNFPREDI
jgi:hypothetical protein